MISDDLHEYEENKHKKFSLLKAEYDLRGRLAPFLLITIAALIVYCNSFSAPFELDDFGSIINNYSIRDPLNFASMWGFYSSRIVAYFTFALNYFIHQNSQIGYHVVNLIIHILNGYLFFLIFRTILGLDYFCHKSLQKYKSIVCLLASFIFIVHPINTSAVTYIVQRIASLAALFVLLSIYYYLKYRTKNKIKYFLLSLFFAIIAMFTKENSAILPFLIILIEVLFLIKEHPIKPLKRIIILSVLLLTIAIVPATALFGGGYSQSDPKAHFKASTSMDRLTYLTSEINVVSRYSELMFLPDRQNFDYADEFPKSKTIFDNNSYISLIFIVLSLAVAVLSFRKNKLITLGIFWYYIGLSVESSVISIRDIYFEHRLYLPSIGFAILIAGIIFSVFSIFKKRFSLQKPMLYFLVFCIFMIPLYSGLTLKRNYLFGDSVRLWSDVVDKAQGSARAWSSLGSAYLNNYNSPNVDSKEYLRLAVIDLQVALFINPNSATSSSNLAKAYFLQKKYKECIEESKNTLSLGKSTYAYHNLGSSYEKLGKPYKALNEYLKGYEFDKKCLFLIEDLGNLYFKLKDYNSADFYYDLYDKYKKFYSNITIENNKKYMADHSLISN